MSCSTTSSKVANLVGRATSAISELSGHRSFYAGAMLSIGGSLGAGLMAANYLRRQRGEKTRSTALTPPAVRATPHLPARTQLKPVEVKGSERCVSCKATAQSKSGGGWYVINGKTYCQDCSPEAAREAKADLVAPPQPVVTTAAAQSTPPPSGPEYLPVEKRMRTKMTPGAVKVQMGLGLDQKAVHYEAQGYLLTRTNGKATGLALTPALRTEQQSDGNVIVHEDRNRWYLTHITSGAIVGPQPYRTLAEGQGVAEILAQINWDRPKSKISQSNQKRALATILAYNQALSSEVVAEQSATIKQVASVPPPITDAAPPTPSRMPPTPAVAVDPAPAGLPVFAATNVSRDLTDKLIADPLGGISRVLADEGDVLFVVGTFGERYEVYRDQVWVPRYEDFNTVGVAQPLNPTKIKTKQCTKCKAKSNSTPVGQAWYRMDFKTFCSGCAPGYAHDEGWELDLDTIGSEVK
ncbi:MAG: hypothetical protein AAF485_07170 [Chloroflexota bacterium]